MYNRITFQLLTFVLIVFSTGSLLGQETFRKYYDVSNSTSEAIPYSLELLSGGDFLIHTSLPGERNLVYPGFIFIDEAGEITQQITFGPGAESSSPPAFTKLRDGNYLVSKRGDDEGVLLLGKYSPSGDLIWSVTGISEGQSAPIENIELSNGDLALMDDIFINIQGQGRIKKTSIIIFNEMGEELRRVISDTVAIATSMFASEDGIVLFGSSELGGLVASYSPITRQEEWVYSFQGDEFGEHSIEDAALLPDGTIGLLVNSLYDNPMSSAVNELFFVRISTEGEELSRTILDRGEMGLHSAKIDITPEGEVAIAYTSVVLVDAEWNTNEQFRFLKLDYLTGEISGRAEFNNPPCFANTIDVKLLPDGGAAILGIGFLCDSIDRTDILLLVFDTNGQITNIRGVTPLELTLTLSPNPTHDLLKVVLEDLSTSAVVRLQLYDANGRKLFSASLDSRRETMLDLSSYPNGTYFLVLRDQTGRTTSRRVIKQ